MTRAHFTPPPLHPSRPGLVRPVRVDAHGLAGPTRAQARGNRWRRTSQGFYVPADVDSTVVEQRILEASVVLPAVGAVTGWAALRWLGARWCDGLTRDGNDQLPVCLAADDINMPVNAILSEERLPLEQIIEVDGVMVAMPAWALAYEMRYASNARDAAVWFCLAAYDDLVSIEEYQELASWLTGWTGIPRMRDAGPLLEENHWSPWEIRMAHIWTIDAGLDKPLANRPIFDRNGRHVATPDLIDPAAGLVGEYDGGVHAAGSQRRRDRDRGDAYRRHGLEVVVMFRDDATNRHAAAARIREAHARARFEPDELRSWTIEPPSWWTPTFTVAQRRALDDEQQARLLGYRRAA